MTKTRLEAFSDGVLAIIITIMVLELKIPHEASLHALEELLPVFFSYILSFVFIAIYWGNHHHMLHAVTHVSGSLLWANMLLVFWLSLIPFVTAWMGENNFKPIPVAAYAVVLLLCGAAYTILQKTIEKNNQLSEKLKDAFAKMSRKGIFSVVAYSLSIPAAFIHTGISALLFIAVAILWVIPDKNIEKAVKE